MDTFFGSLRHAFDMANKTHIIWCVGILLIMAVLAILHHFWKEDAKKIRIWRLLCLLPLTAAVIHFLIYALGEPLIASFFIFLYAIALLALLPVPFAKRRIGYRVTACLTGVLSALLGFYFCATSPNCFNYAHMSYTDSFHALAEQMDRTYVLKDWKEVDFAALEEKYMPLVEEAEQAQDPAKFYDAVNQFCMELHDGHVWVSPGFDTETYPLPDKPRNYGLSMVQLDNGDVIAVCTTEEVQKRGIEDGTLITHWNGKPIGQALLEDTRDQGFPVKANADRMAPIQLSGIGGETIDVTVKYATGTEMTVTLSDLGGESPARKAADAFSRMPELETDEQFEAFLDANFSVRMLDDKCGYLVLNAEVTSSDFQDTLAYIMGDHIWAREMFRENLRELRAQGMEYLVIDLRNNFGGFDEIGCALTSLLTEEDWYGQGLGIRRNGEYISVSDHGIKGDGEFADLQVVALTNYNCASAGDGTSLYLSKLPNVTLAGMTDPNGCNQETGGNCVLSDGLMVVSYPVGLILNEESVPNVDTAPDRISRNPVEVRIPFDYDAAVQIFFRGEDYELDWAMAYLEEHAACVLE
ncbi:MAG: hypothetical protein IJN11_03000 [Oscillospiraceae bacterium]|nr:hypothetical protein [Oscillospiraceae bacterium]